MAEQYTLMEDVYKKSLSERYADYDVYGSEREIHKVVIDGNVFSGYKAFTFIWEKTFVKEPTRSSNGTIGNLNSYATFITPHLKINFAMISIDDYRRLYRLILQKNEFTVTCYDVISDSKITKKMYFAPDQFPTLYTVARKLASGEKFIELTGVKDYTVELIGTNNELDLVSITYLPNYPEGQTPPSESEGENDVYVGAEIIVGGNSSFPTTPPNGFIFKEWLGSDGVVYQNGTVITITDTMKGGLTLTAQWQAPSIRKLSFDYGLSAVMTETDSSTGETVQINDRQVQQGVSIGLLPTITQKPEVVVDGKKYYPYRNGGWYRGATRENAKVSNNDLYWSNYNSTIHCLYEKVPYTITFATNVNQYTIPTATYGYQDNVVLPYLGGVENKTFAGWFTEGDFKNQFASNSSMPPYPLTLYAKWE